MASAKSWARSSSSTKTRSLRAEWPPIISQYRRVSTSRSRSLIEILDLSCRQALCTHCRYAVNVSAWSRPAPRGVCNGVPELGELVEETVRVDAGANGEVHIFTLSASAGPYDRHLSFARSWPGDPAAPGDPDVEPTRARRSATDYIGSARLYPRQPVAW
jgi:hypothetical protein